VEKNVLLLAEGMLARGHEVTAVVSEVQGTPPRGLRVEVLPPHGLTRAARYVNFDEDAGRATHGRFDVVQGFDLTTHQDVLRIGRGVKAVYDEVLDRTRGPLDRLVRSLSPGDRALRRLEERMLQPTSWRVLVTNCHAVKQELVDAYHLDPARIEVVWNGIDVEKITPAKAAAGRAATRAALGLATDDRVVLHVGTGFRRKGVDTTIAAFAKLAASDATLKLVVVGRDGAMRIYRRLARSLGVEARVLFTGPKPVDAGLYGAADVVSLASRYEPFGNVVLEACAAGVPALHTAVGGASEVLRAEGLEALVVSNPESAEELAARMSEALRGGAALSARVRAAAEKHTAAGVIDAYEAIYRRLAG